MWFDLKRSLDLKDLLSNISYMSAPHEVTLQLVFLLLQIVIGSLNQFHLVQQSGHSCVHCGGPKY